MSGSIDLFTHVTQIISIIFHNFQINKKKNLHGWIYRAKFSKSMKCDKNPLQTQKYGPQTYKEMKINICQGARVAPWLHTFLCNLGIP